MVQKPHTGIVAYANTTGPASYDTAAKPTLAFPQIKYIRSIDDVKISALGYIVDVETISGNLASYRVVNPNSAHTHVFAGSALTTHTHSLSPTASSAGALSGTLGTLSGTDLIISGIAIASIVSGITDTIAGTPDGVNVNNVAALGSEVIDTTNLSSVTFYGQAYGFASNNN